MIGGLLKRKKLFEEALTHYYSAYEVFNDDLYAIVNLGAISAVLRREADAKRYYAELAKLCRAKMANGPSDHWNHLCLGEAFVYSGDALSAGNEYKSAVKLGAPVGDLRSAVEQLEFFLANNVQVTVAQEVLASILRPVVQNS
jgi:tetratricopeptide (TPR) repeat protein